MNPQSVRAVGVAAIRNIGILGTEDDRVDLADAVAVVEADLLTVGAELEVGVGVALVLVVVGPEQQVTVGGDRNAQRNLPLGGIA